MKKLSKLLVFGLVGAWFYYNGLFIYNNRYFSGNYCFQERALFFMIPLPGAMDNLSWWLLAAWLLIGLVLTAFQPPKLRKLLFYSAFLLGLAFSYFLINTDSQCHALNRCGTGLAPSVMQIETAAFAKLDPYKCGELATFEKTCGSAYTFRSSDSCSQVVRQLSAYRDAGIDIKPCQKSLRDCRSEYYRHFHDILSNDLSAATNECAEKFAGKEGPLNLCHNYLNEWRQSGSKPLPANP